MIAVATEWSPDGRNWLAGIVSKFVRGLGCGSSGRERTATPRRIRGPLRVKKIFGVFGAGQRPVVLVAPLIAPHHENFHALAVGEIILDTLKKKIVPTKSDVAFLEFCRFGTEVGFTDFAAGTGVAADGHQKLLAFAGFRRCGARF